MKKTSDLYDQLSMRERQIMDVLLRLKRASTQEVLNNLPNPPTYNSVRSILSIMVNKGYIKSYQEGKKLIYHAISVREKEKGTMLKKMINNFYDGSAPKAISTILNFSTEDLSRQDIAELKKLIEEAEKKKND